MVIVKSRSIKMPTYNSYFVGNFETDVLETLKENRPFAFYHRGLQQYEITAEIYETHLKHLPHELHDITEPFEVFNRITVGEYGYQEDAVLFSDKTNSLLINFSQGMGKTLTSFKILKHKGIGKALVICGQGNLQEEWLKDAIKHNILNTFNVRIIGEDTGVGNKKKLKWLENNRPEQNDVHLVNIEALRDVNIVKYLNDNNYDCIIIDEVQAAKGWKADKTKGLHEIVTRDNQLRIALSGTPILNDPLEYFSVLKFLGVLKDTVRTTFEAYYGEWGFDFWGNRKIQGYRNLKDLSQLLKPVLCYAPKSELGLPPKRRRKLVLPWADDKEFKKLQAIYKLPIKRLRTKGYNTKPQVRALMQILSSTTPEKVDFVHKLSKQGKTLVFSMYTTVLEHYEKALKAQDVRVLYYHGDLKMKERLQVLQDWFNDEADVLLLSEMTARFGLNLTEAVNTAFVEPPTSLGILEQCEDRAHRIGQAHQVNSYLLCSSPLDEKALKNIEEKQKSIDELKELLIN